MKLEQVAVQMYTLRDFMQTAADVRQTLEKVAAIGYRSIQYSGPRPMPATEVAKICADLGLTINSTHEDSSLILNDPEQVVENLQSFGCKYTAYPYPSGIDFTSVEVVDKLIAQLDASGKVLHEAGCVLTYHNHSDEFVKLEGEVVLDRIFRKTDPRYLQGEPDTYWVQLGGGDPVAWCEKLKDRLPLLHLKDFLTLPGRVTTFAEIGQGVLDFKRIIAAAEASGCEWFMVEQDTTPGDPFDSLKISFDYIKANLVD